MQIRMYTENGIHVTAGKAAQIKGQSAQTSDNAFGAQCRVSISSEGRKLSEQPGAQTARSARSIKAEKMMLRQQKQSAQAENARDGYLEQLKEFDKTATSLNCSFESEADKEAIEKKQQVIKEMREQKEKQLEENQKKQKEAQQMAAQSLGMQEEIDENNRDLLILLKSIEESEKAKEENEEKGNNGDTQGQSGSGGFGTKNSVSDVIRNSAAQFGASSARRELNVVDMINELNAEGHRRLDEAGRITKGILKQSQNIREMLDDENYTDEEKEEEISRYLINVLDAYKDISRERGAGLQMIKDSRECKLKHIADNPLNGVEETKESMQLSAVDVAINEAAQGKLDETSQELADEVEKLIDERNDVTHVEPDKKEDEKEQKEIGELLKTEEDGQDKE